MPTPNNRRLSGFNTNNSNIRYSETNTIDQIRRAILDKDLSLVKTLLGHVSRDDVRVKWTQNVFNTLEIARARFIGGRQTSRVDQINILHIAATRGYTSMVRVILDSKPSLLNSKTSQGFTALQLALILGRNKTARYLVERKAGLKHALSAAVIGTQPDMTFIRYLIVKGANVNEKDNMTGATPIFFANSTEMIDLLVSKGANVNQKDIYGWTPLMAIAGLIYINVNLLTSNPVDLMKKLVEKGANVCLRGRNREPQENEKKITLLHATMHSLGKIRTQELSNIYTYITSEFRSRNKGIRPRTTLGNTPMLYLTQYLKKCINNNNTLPRMKQDFPRFFKNLATMHYSDVNVPEDTNSGGRTVKYYLRDLVNTMNFPSNFKNAYIWNVSNTHTNNNIHIPNNLNRTDPISINAVNINNAYIIKKDLLNKTINENGRRVRIKEVKTVYNKSSLNGMVATGRSLVSPITRRPFTAQDIVKLSTVASANEMTRYKNSRRS